MLKSELMQSVATAFNVEPTARDVAYSLGLAIPSVSNWPDEGHLTRGVLRGVAGDFIRRGVKVPADIVKALKESR